MAIRNRKDVEQRFNSLAVRVERAAEKMVRTVALAVDSTVTNSTPVDTGRARSNWGVSVGAPGTMPTDEILDPSVKLARDESIVATYRAGKDAIYIANNLPYIQKLNEGSSSQAPAGFVETAILNGVEIAKRQKLVSDK